MRPLSARAGSALRWGTLTTLARFGLQLGTQVLLARLLGPAAYGVYALGLTLLGLANYLAGPGFSQHLVLRPVVTAQEIRLAWTWQTGAGLVCALALAGTAAPLAAFFRMPELTATLRWMAVACVLTAASGTAMGLMQRALDMRRQGLAQLAAYAAGYLGAGLSLALAGWQAQALAVACVVQAGALLLMLLWLHPHPLRPQVRGPGLRQLWTTARRVLVTNGVNWLTTNLDRLVIGRLLPAQALGGYALAWNLSQIPVTLLVGATQPALLASGTELARDRRRLAGAWSLSMRALLVLLPGPAAGLALLAPDSVVLLYGAAWAAAGPLLALMLLALPAWAVWALSTPVLWHSGQARREASVQVPWLLVALPAWAWAALDSERAGLSPAPAVAAVSVVLLYARAVVTARAALRCLDLQASALYAAMGRGLALAALCGLLVSGLQTLGSALGSSLGWALGPRVAPLGAAASGPLPSPGLAALRLACAGIGLLGLMVWVLRRPPQSLGPQARAVLRRLGGHRRRWRTALDAGPARRTTAPAGGV